MACCCSDFVEIGCADYCSAIDLGFDAIQNGVHTAEVYVVNGVIKDIILSAVLIGDDLEIPGGVLNETKTHDLRIKQPDGSYYLFATAVDCARLTTQIHIT